MLPGTPGATLRSADKMETHPHQPGPSPLPPQHGGRHARGRCRPGLGRPCRRCRRAVLAIGPAGSDLGAVEHVVYLMLENRSFDHYYGAFPGAHGFSDHGTALGAFSQAWPQAPATTCQPTTCCPTSSTPPR